MIIEYGVNLTPVAQPRAGLAESFKDMAPYEEGRLEQLMGLPVTLEVEFQIKRPKAMCGESFSQEKIPHTKKPDADNLLKAVMDALNKVAWNDDSQVISAKSSKFYSPVVFGGKTGKARNSDVPLVNIKIEYHE
jgi:hypothetical protein